MINIYSTIKFKKWSKSDEYSSQNTLLMAYMVNKILIDI